MEKKYKNEMKIYEILGVRLFRKLIMCVEKVRHYKDDSRNINYHIDGGSINSLNRFCGYLYFNASCHIISTILIVLYFIAVYILSIRLLAIDICMLVFLFVNIYCIMLQRYTYIKIQILKSRRTLTLQKKAYNDVLLLEYSLENRDTDKLYKEYSLICKFRESSHSGEDIYLLDEDFDVLQVICKMIDKPFLEKTINSNVKKNTRSLSQHLSSNPSKSLVINKAERYASAIQNLLQIPRKNNVQFGYCIITDSERCEAIFRELFSSTSRESFEYAIDILYQAYKKRLYITESYC